jgi:hypothetical protein
MGEISSPFLFEYKLQEATTMSGAGTSPTGVGKAVRTLRARIREWHQIAMRGVPEKSVWGLVDASIEELIWEVMMDTLKQKRGKETMPVKEKLRPEVEAMRKREKRNGSLMWR